MALGKGRARGRATPPFSLAGVLKEARERSGLTVRDLARRMGVSPATVGGAERGVAPQVSTLQGWLDALPSLSPESLFGRPSPRPQASTAAWAFARDAHDFGIGRLHVEVVPVPGGAALTHLVATDIRMKAAEPRDGSSPAAVARLVHLLFRGSPEARRELAAGLRADPVLDGTLRVTDACFEHAFERASGGSGFTWTREQVAGLPPPAGFSAPGQAPLSAPFRQGVSITVEHPVERLDLVVRFRDGLPPTGARCFAWTDLQSVSADEPDLAPFLYPTGLRVRRSTADRTLRVTIPHPDLGLHFGLGWGDEARPEAPPAAATRARGTLGRVVARARAAAGLSQRDVALRIGTSPVTVAKIEAGADPRHATMARLLGELPGIEPRDFLRASAADGPLSPADAWARCRDLLGVESDEECKTLVVTAEGDAHALCETLGLRRVHASAHDLRIRYPSAQALGKRLPTELRAIEAAVAARAEDLGLRARVVARQQGRLIHEIVVPAHVAREGVSFTRRLFNARFFDPRAEAGERGESRDGAAIVPFHATRRLALIVRFPSGFWPSRWWFGCHPRTMLDGPLPEADLAASLHPAGLMTRADRRARVLELRADLPVVGCMYDIFWQ